LSDSQKCAIVSLHELLESSNVAMLARLDKIQVIARIRHHFELCRARCHMCSTRFGKEPLVEPTLLGNEKAA
jgi:hypothetical protein